MGTIIVCSIPAFLIGMVTGAIIMRKMAITWIKSMEESREELLKRLMAEFGEDTIERIVGKMIMDLIEENEGR